MEVSLSNKVVVIGQGYVGLPLALEAAKSGWCVTGIEIDAEKFSLLSNGISPVEDVSDSQLQGSLQDNSYFVSQTFDSLGQADIIVICVPTPLDFDGKPDLAPLRDVVEEIIKRAPDQALIINESTSYPGTVQKEIQAKVLKARPSSQMLFVAAPERVDPGNSKFNHRNTPRIIGSDSSEGARKAKEFYGSFCEEVIVCADSITVEMAKLLENSYRLVNIALINEIAEICTISSIDIREVIAAAQTKPFGFMAFKPGLGVGGHCIPVDPLYLAWYAEKLGSDASLIKLSSSVNHERTQNISRRIRDLVPEEGRILVVGLGYKAQTRDTRESPSLELIHSLRKQGLKVSWQDSFVGQWNGEASEESLDADLLVYVHPYLNLSDLGKFNGIIVDLTGTLKGLQRVLSF
jgi:UDP-N-acetyl-D-glucosamine dehydrogenase